MSLRSAQFESYINWLLTECEILSKGDYITLCDHPPLDLQSEIVNTKGIEFHAPVSFEPIERKIKDTETTSISFKPDNIGWELLSKILPPEMTLPSELKASEVLLNNALEVRLFLSWGRTRKDDSTVLLDRISNQLRHIDTELDYTIHTRSGKISKDDFKLKRSISVGQTNEGLVKKSEMWERIQEWLEILISEDKITPET